jgi:hypothetical protein
VSFQPRRFRTFGSSERLRVSYALFFRWHSRDHDARAKALGGLRDACDE